MLAYHMIRAQAEYRSRDLLVPRRALYHWATDLLVKPQSDIHCNRSATSPRLTIFTDRRGRNKLPDRSRRGCREVGDWSGTSLRLNQSQPGFCGRSATSCIKSQRGPHDVADQSPISRRPVPDQSPTSRRPTAKPSCNSSATSAIVMNFGRGEVAERLQCMSDLGLRRLIEFGFSFLS